MFKKRNIRPSKVQHNDQLPFLAQERFSALPRFRDINKDEPGLSVFVAVLHVIDLLGVFPLLILPGLLISLGLVAIPMVLVVVGLQIYTSFLLGKCWIIAEVLDPTISLKNRYPYAAIGDMAYGKHFSFLVTTLLDLNIFASGIPSLVVASQNLQLIGHRLSDGHFFFSFCYWLIIIGILICPLMWIESPKSMRGLTIFSVVVLVSVMILLLYCLINAEGWRNPFYEMTNVQENVALFHFCADARPVELDRIYSYYLHFYEEELPSFLSVLSGYSMLAFQFDIHSMILTIQVDMQDKHQIKWVSVVGILGTFGLGLIITIIVAYKYGSAVTPNILELLPNSVALYIAILLISLQLCLSCVAGSSALFLNFENFFRVPEKLSLKRIFIRSWLVGLEVIIGELVPKFDVLVGLVGGTISGPLMFIFPPLLYRKIQQMETMRHRIITQAAYGSLPMDLNYECLEMTNDTQSDTYWSKSYHRMRQLCKYSPCEMTFSSGIVAFGVLALVCATYLNLQEITELFEINSPCFRNITNSFRNV